MSPVIFGNVDIAMLSLYAFFLFFIGLVIYLNRESRREGYPLEDEMTGQVFSPKIWDLGRPKVFRLPHGHGAVHPKTARDDWELKAKKTWGSYGSPYVPTGNPLVDGVGPAAYAKRAQRPDLDFEGHPRIVPLRTVEELSVDARDSDPRGYVMYGSDGLAAGVVTEIWIDKSDRLIRYLETELPNGKHVMVPMTMVLVKARKAAVQTDSIAAGQFADAPVTSKPTTVTLDEEERIVAYFGGGYLYSSPERQEPIL
jgi:photosynthetic reaction center H subunit